MMRVGGNTDPAHYDHVGRDAATQMMKVAAEHSKRPLVDLLDWGCGPGRVARHLINDRPEINVRGCDIDAEAIDWCNCNVAGGVFCVSSLWPPLPYTDESFDVVLACSVMTHLSRRAQRVWLTEIARVLRCGGVFVATVHGRTAAAAALGITDLVGIRDHYLDNRIDGIAPPGYYRGTFQTQEYTRDAWSDHLSVVGYTEAGLEAHDVVTCRKPLDGQHSFSQQR